MRANEIELQQPKIQSESFLGRRGEVQIVAGISRTLRGDGQALLFTESERIGYCTFIWRLDGDLDYYFLAI